MDEPEFLRNLEGGVPRLLTGISWERYLDLCEQMSHRRLRTIYCDNEFEIMPASFEHERRLCMIDNLFCWFAMRARDPMNSTGSTTFRRPDLQIAMEPDRSYYLTNCHFVRVDRELDLMRDPPPDLVLEVDIPDRSARRMRVLAGLGVPELWRYDGQKLRLYLLLGNGEYIEAERSACCPLFPIVEIHRFVQMQAEMDDGAVVRRFCEWLEEQCRGGQFATRAEW